MISIRWEDLYHINRDIHTQIPMYSCESWPLQPGKLGMKGVMGHIPQMTMLGLGVGKSWLWTLKQHSVDLDWPGSSDLHLDALYWWKSKRLFSPKREASPLHKMVGHKMAWILGQQSFLKECVFICFFFFEMIIDSHAAVRYNTVIPCAFYPASFFFF